MKSNSIGMPNPVEEFATIEEASKHLQFKTVVPKEIPEGYKLKFISTISRELFQVGYDNEKNNILFRMAKEIDKIDGDYNDYKINKTIIVNNNQINLKGNKNNLVNLATFKIKDMSYSISVEKGMSEDDIIKIVKSIF
ncbi:DUF4367 domain-containing protein [Haloimpatiens sp. FM7315]|uniref:DUF4367 domain-containing protein n=1 Tax=Haloimpatiens sp. FM7315 TaxID=3298609 RepID=UPI00370AFC53